MIRGSTFYARWMIPRPLQAILGKSHFVRSLRTKNLHEARRLLRAAGWEYEALLRQGEGSATQPLQKQLQTASETNPALPSKPKSRQKTFEQVFDLFVSDPTKKRAKKTIEGYRDGIEIIYSVVGRQTPIGDIDREACRKLLETLQWLPANSPKKFPTLTAVQAARLAKQNGRKDLLGPVSINGYMIMLSSILNFAINEEMIERNPCRGLRVIDPVKKRDKRLPFSDDQLRIIFNGPPYRAEIEAYPYIARCMIQQFKADGAVNLLDQVMASVQKRLDRSRSSLTIYELQTYLDWIDTIRNRVVSIQQENANRPQSQPEVASGLLKSLMKHWLRGQNPRP